MSGKNILFINKIFSKCYSFALPTQNLFLKFGNTHFCLFSQINILINKNSNKIQCLVYLGAILKSRYNFSNKLN